jgi:hypothetical protein
MSNHHRQTDISDARQQPARRNRASMGEASLAERRARAALTERRLPQVPAGALPGLTNGAPTRLLTEDERRQRSSYSLPERELKQRSVDALRAELSPEVTEIARRHKLNLIATRTLEVIYRAQKAAGDVYISLSPASIADILNAAPQQGPNKISADQIRDIISALAKLGALNQQAGFGPGTKSALKVNA